MDSAFLQQFLASLPIIINFALVNCNSSWLANAVYFMTQPNNHPSATLAQCGLMESCYQCGRFMMAIPGGMCSDKYGRKYLILAIGCIQVVTWGALSTLDSVIVIYIVRFFQGCAASLSNNTGSLTIGEISSPKYRSLFIMILKSAGTLGNIAECLIASFFGSYALTVYSTAVLSLVFLFTLPWVTESPYYLASVSRGDESKRVLWKLRKGLPEDEISAEYDLLCQSVEHAKSVKAEHNFMKYLALPSTRRPLICCLLLNALVLANGTNVIALYATVMFPPNEYFSNRSYPLVLSLVQLASSMGTALFMDKLPRRHLYAIGALLAFVTQSINGAAYYACTVTVDEQQKSVWKMVFLVGTVTFWIVANVIILPLNLIVKSEILPLSIRGFGNSICLICQALSTIACYQIFNFVRAYFGIAMNYVVFAGNSLLMIAVVYFLLPETRGKTLAQVQEKLLRPKREKAFHISRSPSALKKYSRVLDQKTDEYRTFRGPGMDQRGSHEIIRTHNRR